MVSDLLHAIDLSLQLKTVQPGEAQVPFQNLHLVQSNRFIAE